MEEEEILDELKKLTKKSYFKRTSRMRKCCKRSRKITQKMSESGSKI